MESFLSVRNTSNEFCTFIFAASDILLPGSRFNYKCQAILNSSDTEKQEFDYNVCRVQCASHST